MWLTIYAMMVAMAVDIPFAIVEIYTSGVNMAALEPAAVMGILWVGVIPTAVSNLLWSRALEKLPAATCSLFYAIMPITTGLLGVVLLAESMTVRFAAGSAVVIAGVIVAILGERKNDSLPPQS